jgi:acyl carrier protein
MSDLLERVRAVVKTDYPHVLEDLVEGATFDAAGMDSLHVVGLLMAMQQEFGVTMNGVDVDVDATLADVVTLLRAKGVTEEKM